MSIAMPERWVSMEELCEYLGVKRYTVMKWIETKSMPAVKAGRFWKFKITEVDEWLRTGGAAE